MTNPGATLRAAVGTGARQARAPRELRDLHRVVLRHFLDTGAPPEVGWLRERAASLGMDPERALPALSEADLVHCGPAAGDGAGCGTGDGAGSGAGNEAGDGAGSGTGDGAGSVVTIAYPFSGTPTVHVVRLATGVRVYAMCALDALGIAPMSGLDIVIDSVDPTSGDQVRVELAGGAWRWDPASAVTLAARSSNCGPSATCSCPHMNFHSRREHAESYLRAHPGLDGLVLDQPSSVEAGRHVFGGLMRESE